MKRLLSILCLLIPLLSWGENGVWKAGDVEMVHLKDARRYVCNPDGVLSAAATDSIDRMLSRLEKEKGVQSVVVAVKRVENADPYSFGMAIARKYGVGNKKARTGLVIVLATQDRAYQILTGNGLEGALPDATCRMIEVHHMDPHLKKGDWDRAMVEGVRAVCNEVSKDSGLRNPAPQEPTSASPMLLLVLIGVIALFVWVMSDAAKRRCPRCGRKDMSIKDRRLLSRAGPYDYYELTYRCRRCGYEQKQVVREHHEDGGSSVGAGLAAGALLGSMFGRGRGGGWGGGSFGGGSFGGGSFGGGGAGGRF